MPDILERIKKENIKKGDSIELILAINSICKAENILGSTIHSKYFIPADKSPIEKPCTKVLGYLFEIEENEIVLMNSREKITIGNNTIIDYNKLKKEQYF